MDIDELLRAGSDICEDVIHAVNMNDYSDLGRKITERVNEVTGQFSGMGNRTSGTDGVRKYDEVRTGQDMQNRQAARNGNSQGGRPRGYEMPQSNSNWNRDLSRRQLSFFLKNRVSKATGVGKMIIGGIGTAFNGLLTIISAGALAAAAGGTAALWGVGIFGALTAASVLLLINGSKNRALVDKYYRYGKELGQAEYFSISQLAEKLGMSEKDLHKEIDEMMKKGYLPQAKYDRGETKVILTENAYEQYRLAEESRLQREADERSRQEEDRLREERLNSSALGKDAAEVLKQGNEYLKRIRELNEAIPDADMTNKLYRLEEIMNRIFEQVEKQPESAQSLRRFMEYYLPTTEKLLQAYVDLDRQPEVGDNITKPKQQIEEAMDTINDAFEKLLDSLFVDMAWDISSDINVMKTMMAQDGLTEEAGGFAQAAMMAEQDF